MSTLSGYSEIVESTELNPRSKIDGLIQKHRMLKRGQVCSVGDDMNKLFEAMDKQLPATSLGLSEQVSKTSLRKRAMKRPMTSCSKIGFSDSVSLKQAFRGLSISQASEMAAIKRLSKQVNFSRTSNSVFGNKNLVEISLIPEESTSKFPGQKKMFMHTKLVKRNGVVLPKVDKIPRSLEKVEFSHNSNSSISSTSTSNKNTITCHRPHTSNDVRWEVIRCFRKSNGCLGLEHFKLIKKIGSGDIGNVYLAELMGTDCLFALKMMDKELLVRTKKVCRAENERETLEMLDHPFLPTLFAYLTTERFSVLVMEYFPGGDLDVLRKKQPKKRFSEQASRFYIAEVLLALEYLHMLGIVYRDLKPENVLLREDGHIVLSDFDLSLKCPPRPKVLEISPVLVSPKTKKDYNSESKCIHPLCFWRVPCFTPKLLSPKSHNKHKADMAEEVIIAEPTNALSNSFVGTHEYLAPKIIRGEGHGSAIDWWTLGIFVYELVYGKTPFKGPTNEDTTSNIVSHGIKFPDIPNVGPNTIDLIVGLLAEDPEKRLGYMRGASEIKQHPFFEGINWALIRCTVAPELPSGNAVKANISGKNKVMKCQNSLKVPERIYSSKCSKA